MADEVMLDIGGELAGHRFNIASAQACECGDEHTQLLRTTAPNPQFYWRVFTPLILLWCLIVQRLQHNHTGDTVVSHLHTGAADALDPVDPHVQPRSQRLRSESTSAYAQGRERVPVSLIWAVNRHLIQTVRAWVAATPSPNPWKGHAVRLLDGTTFRLAPTPELVTTYGQARNQHGDGYWVIYAQWPPSACRPNNARRRPRRHRP